MNTIQHTAVAALTLLFVVMPAAGTEESTSKSLMDLELPSATDQWISVNDGVMGGISRGAFRIAEEDSSRFLVFSGTLSLENRGGFASIRTRPADLNLGDFDTMVLRVRGDGRTYYFDLRTRALGGAESYRLPVTTRKGAWQEVRLPMEDFAYTSFGRLVSGSAPLNPAKVVSFGFMLADKQPGPFRLDIASVAAEKGGGTDTAAGDAGPPDIVDTAVAAGDFKSLLAAAEAADLVEALKGEGPLTVFAPNDGAFGKLPEGAVEDLLEPENREALRALLAYHVVPGEILLGSQSPTTLQGEALQISAWGPFEVDGAKVLAADILAANGVIHVIDTVLTPPAKTLTPGGSAMRLIERAIERGVPLFNSGQHEGCVAVYEVTAESLLTTHEGALTEEQRAILRKALRAMRDDETAREQAWTLRRAVDAIYASLADG